MKPFSASRIGELLTGGKTAQSYCYDLCIDTLGLKEDFDTKEMKHGRVNQVNAFDTIVKPIYPDAVWFDSFLSINDKCGASPDIINGSMPIDVKCPYYVDTFMEQIHSVPKKYYAQVQMQMMALNSEEGALAFYLTKPEQWGEEEWEEYPIELERRFKIFEFKKDDEIQDNILKSVEEYHPKKVALLDNLKNAIELDFQTFYEMQFEGDAFRKLKTAYNIFAVDEVYRVGGQFYYLKKKKNEKKEM